MHTHIYIYIHIHAYTYTYIHTYIYYIYTHTRVVLSLERDDVSGHVARQSDLKLTVSIFLSAFCLLHVRSMVGREVDGQHVLSLHFVFYIFD